MSLQSREHQLLRFHGTFCFTGTSLRLQLDTVQALSNYRPSTGCVPDNSSLLRKKAINVTPDPLHVRISTPPCIHQRMDPPQVGGLQQGGGTSQGLHVGCRLPNSFTPSLTHSLTSLMLSISCPMSHRMVMMQYRMLQRRIAFGSRLDMTSFGRIKERLLDCVVDWGNILTLVAHNCADCIMELCMVAEHWLWNQGNSEREWTLE